VILDDTGAVRVSNVAAQPRPFGPPIDIRPVQDKVSKKMIG
jgi:hypothetical protein